MLIMLRVYWFTWFMLLIKSQMGISGWGMCAMGPPSPPGIFNFVLNCLHEFWVWYPNVQTFFCLLPPLGFGPGYGPGYKFLNIIKYNNILNFRSSLPNYRQVFQLLQYRNLICTSLYAVLDSWKFAKKGCQTQSIQTGISCNCLSVLYLCKQLVYWLINKNTALPMTDLAWLSTVA